MSEGKSNRWLLVFGGAGVVALVVGLFVLMSADAPAGTPAPTPETPPVERPDPGRSAADHATIGPASPAPDKPADTPPAPAEKPVVHDHSGEPPDPERRKEMVPPQLQNNVFKYVTQPVAACSPPRTSGEGDGKPRGFATVSYTVVVEQGKARLEQVDAKAETLSAEHLACIKKAFEGVGFDTPTDQAPGRYPITLQFAVP